MSLARVLPLLLTTACSSSGLSAVSAGRALEVEPGTWLLPWGDGEGRVGLRVADGEFKPMGPSSVAVAATGDVLVLDALHGRVLSLTEKGGVSVATAVPPDTRDLAVSADGALAAYSPLRARAFVFDRDGAAGEVAVPRTLREARGIRLGPSRQVLVQTSFQETFLAGSPAMPQPEAAVLAARLPGEWQLADGTGLAVVVADRRPRLLLLRGGVRESDSPGVLLEERCDAARIVGVEGGAVCLRLEQLGPGPAISVSRRLVCVDALTGAPVLARDLPPPGLYTPRRELAVGAGHVALIRAAEDGLRVSSWALPSGRAP
jgi:hypothetical protein